MANNIYLTGFMGSGKSTIGRLLAKRLGHSFADTDALIEAGQGRRIPGIFAGSGEKAFRRLEERAVLTASRRRGGIVSTGGGAVLSARNRRNMARSGTSVFLSCTFAALWQRLQKDRRLRPLLGNGGKAGIRALLRRRMPFYRRADITVSVTGKTPVAAAAEILRKMKKAGMT